MYFRRFIHMKVVIAIDSLKGSLSSMEAGMAIKDGILAAKPDAEVIVKPLADGGEGTTDALIEGMNGERIDLTVTGPMHTPVDAYYGYLKEYQQLLLWRWHPQQVLLWFLIQKRTRFLQPVMVLVK